MSNIAMVLRQDRAEARKNQILAILASGKSVRFTACRDNGDVFWKEVAAFNPNGDGDLIADRISDNARSAYICWDSSMYEISAVDRPQDTQQA